MGYQPKDYRMRGLSVAFIRALKSGVLQPLLNLVQLDSTLCLEIRQDYVNVYYRGGNILRVEERGDSFNAGFDRKYLLEDSTRVPKKLPSSLSATKDVDKWIDCIPFLKHEMDLWFGKHPKDEREFQQVMLRENNFGNTAKGTDYFICDIEYANPHGRFDLVAVHWASSAAARKQNENLDLAFIEMKYTDKALAGTAGLKTHIEDVNNFLGDPDNLRNIKDEMKNIFNQKLELGLIRNQNPIEHFSDNIPEYILAIANHNPASSILKRELETLPLCPNIKLRFAVSNFMGYGLYRENIYPLDAFLSQFGDQI